MNMEIGDRRVTKYQIGENTIFDSSEGWRPLELGDGISGKVFGRINREASTISLWGFIYFSNIEGSTVNLVIKNGEDFSFNILEVVYQDAFTGTLSGQGFQSKLLSSPDGLVFSIMSSAPKTYLSTFFSSRMGFLQVSDNDPVDFPIILK